MREVEVGWNRHLHAKKGKEEIGNNPIHGGGAEVDASTSTMTIKPTTTTTSTTTKPTTTAIIAVSFTLLVASNITFLVLWLTTTSSSSATTIGSGFTVLAGSYESHGYQDDSVGNSAT